MIGRVEEHIQTTGVEEYNKYEALVDEACNKGKCVVDTIVKDDLLLTARTTSTVLCGLLHSLAESDFQADIVNFFTRVSFEFINGAGTNHHLWKTQCEVSSSDYKFTVLSLESSTSPNESDESEETAAVLLYRLLVISIPGGQLSGSKPAETK